MSTVECEHGPVSPSVRPSRKASHFWRSSSALSMYAYLAHGYKLKSYFGLTPCQAKASLGDQLSVPYQVKASQGDRLSIPCTPSRDRRMRWAQAATRSGGRDSRYPSLDGGSDEFQEDFASFSFSAAFSASSTAIRASNGSKVLKSRGGTRALACSSGRRGAWCSGGGGIGEPRREGGGVQVEHHVAESVGPERREALV